MGIRFWCDYSHMANNLNYFVDYFLILETLEDNGNFKIEGYGY